MAQCRSIWLTPWAGGAHNYLDARVQKDLDDGLTPVILRVGGAQRWQVELVTPAGQVVGTTDDTAMVQQLLEPLVKRCIIYSCGVGDPDPVQLPGFLTSLKRHPGDRIEVLFHDYFPLSPSYTLLRSDGIYYGPPIAGKSSDRAHMTRRPDGTEVSLAAWQQAWHGLAEAADELQVFSRDSAAQVASVWPDLVDRIRIRPHHLLADVPRIEPPENPTRPVIGILGNIGYQKGAKLLQDLAAGLTGSPAARDRIGMVLIGNIDPHYRLPKSVPVLGSYMPKDIATLARKHGVTHWLIPSIWPETFSYATREALATGLPVLAFAIGAQGEAVAAEDNGHPMPFTPKDDLVATVIGAINKLTGESW
jgi:glycosyltransferase involved in cell wall biosynthesis